MLKVALRRWEMTEITVFALALLAVPVFARFGRVSSPVVHIYHLIGLGGLFMLLGEATRMTAGKIGFVAAMLPAIDWVTGIIAYALVLIATLWVAFYYVRHLKEV